MSEAERAEIIRQWYGGGSFRGIARALGMNRKTVAAVIKAHKDKRAQPHLSVPAPASQRKSLLDPYVSQIETLLQRYPDLTAVRLQEELCAAGFKGGYSIVKQRLRQMRPAAGAPTGHPIRDRTGGSGADGLLVVRDRFSRRGQAKSLGFQLHPRLLT